MSLRNETKELILYAFLMLIVITIFAYTLFKLTGVMVVLGIVLISLPFYFILHKFELPEGEKFVFSILIGLTILPSLTYAFGLLISFRIAMAISFAIFIILAVALNKIKPKK